MTASTVTALAAGWLILAIVATVRRAAAAARGAWSAHVGTFKVGMVAGLTLAAVVVLAAST